MFHLQNEGNVKLVHTNPVYAHQRTAWPQPETNNSDHQQPYYRDDYNMNCKLPIADYTLLQTNAKICSKHKNHNVWNAYFILKFYLSMYLILDGSIKFSS